jgi:hypothetical protein
MSFEALMGRQLLPIHPARKAPPSLPTGVAIPTKISPYMRVKCTKTITSTIFRLI